MKPIEEMTGLELREACAIEVMGWERCRSMMQSKADKEPRGWRDPNHRGAGTAERHLPAYESSIEAAFQLVEKMRENVCMEMTCGAAGYSVEFTPYCGVGWGAFQSDSLPLAICRAALKAARAK